MDRPFSLFVNTITPDLRDGFAATKHLKEPLSPQCQSETSFPFFWMPQPSPQKMVLDSSLGVFSVQLVHSGFTAICGVSISRNVARFNPTPFTIAATKSA